MVIVLYNSDLSFLRDDSLAPDWATAIPLASRAISPVLSAFSHTEGHLASWPVHHFPLRLLAFMTTPSGFS